MDSSIDLTRERVFKDVSEREGFFAGWTDWDYLVGRRPRLAVQHKGDTPFAAIFDQNWSDRLFFTELSSALGFKDRGPYMECLESGVTCDRCGRDLRFYDGASMCLRCEEDLALEKISVRL